MQIAIILVLLISIVAFIDVSNRRIIITDPEKCAEWIQTAAIVTAIRRSSYFSELRLDFNLRKLMRKAYGDDRRYLCPHVKRLVIESGTVVAKHPSIIGLYRIN